MLFRREVPSFLEREEFNLASDLKRRVGRKHYIIRNFAVVSAAYPNITAPNKSL